MNDIDLLRNMMHELTETDQPQRFMSIIRKLGELIHLAECVAVCTDIELREQAKKILEVEE